MSSGPTYNLVSEKQNKEKLFTVRQGAPQNKKQLLCGAWFSEGKGTIHPQTEGGFSTTSTSYVGWSPHG